MSSGGGKGDENSANTKAEAKKHKRIPFTFPKLEITTNLAKKALEAAVDDENGTFRKTFREQIAKQAGVKPADVVIVE